MTLAPWRKSYDLPRQHIKNQRHYFPDNGPSHQIYHFSSSYVWMWELDHKECWAPKNWCFQIVVLENTLESPLVNKEFKPVNPKGKQPWIFTGRTDAEAVILWPPDVKSWLTGKDPDARKGCSVQSFSCVWLFVTPWIAACQASLSITNSRSLPKLSSTESVMPSNHFILCRPLLLCPQFFPASGSFPVSQLFTSGGWSIGA